MVALWLPNAASESLEKKKFEAALSSQSATMGGSFWTRIRLGKAVAGPGVRGQDDRDKWTQTSFFLGIQRRR